MNHTRRKITMGLNATVLTAAVAGILVLAYIISLRTPLQFDVTKSRRNTLAPETRNLVRTLEQKKIRVHATAFFPARTAEARQVSDLFSQLSRRTEFFQYESIDPLTRPGEFRRWGMDDYGVIIWTGTPGAAQFRRKVLAKSDLFQPDPMTGEETFTGEQAVLNAVVSVALKKDAMMCFLEGQGEFAITDQKQDGLSKLADMLEAEAFTITVAQLSGGRPIPEDCRVAILAGPQRPLVSQDREVLMDFLSRGGGLLLLLHGGSVPGTDDLLAPWGLALADKILVDKSRSADPDGFMVRPELLDHEITAGMDKDGNSMKLLYPSPLSVAGRAPAGVAVAPVLQTSRAAVECSLVDYEVYQQLECADKQARHVLAAAVTQGRGQRAGRVLVAGNSLFITNDFLRSTVQLQDNVVTAQSQASEDNALFALNSIHWLAGEEDVITLRPRPADQDMLKDSYDYAHRMMVFKLFTFVIPLGILILGGVIWRWRRSL